MTRLDAPIPAEPDGWLAATLTDLAADRPGGVFLIARSENRAALLAVAARALAPGLAVVHVPAWDCMPYDRVPPSRRIMGERLAALRRLTELAGTPCLLIAGIDAAVQLVPPPSDRRLVLRAGDAIDPDGLTAELTALGYGVGDRVDDPGEVAARGEVIDIFPADAPLPCRVEYEAGRVTDIRRYDPLTQRSTDHVEVLTVGLASELTLVGEAVLTSLLAMLPDALLVQDDEVETLRDQRWSDIAASFRDLGAATEDGCLPPAALYLDEASWAAACAGRDAVTVTDQPAPAAMPPHGLRSTASLLRFVRAAREAGRSIGLAGPAKPRRALLRALERAGEPEPMEVAGWAQLRRLEPGTIARMEGSLAAGFVGMEACVLAPADILGARGLPDAGRRVETGLQAALRPGDAVVHALEGLGVLRGIETVEGADLLRLEYAGGETLMVQAHDLHHVWRYGGDASGLTLDKIGGDAWPKRRREVEGQIAETAATLVELARARDAVAAPVMNGDQAALRRFAARFGFPATADQEAAMASVTADLAAGRPMQRLVCGDVGFGKTEVALWAAAVAAMSGWQVAVVVPTTVLARQHAETFTRRFARTGIRVGALSRLTSAADARDVRAAIADGSVSVAIGTQALAGKDVRFKKLGLLIVDEEQHFGTRQKAALAKLHEGVHVLTLTATPIPRTLQAALAGLQEVSLIATPPVRRQPVRSVRADLDGLVVGQSLLRERRRGGQSFVVCPRVEDIAPWRERLAIAVPGLSVIEAHGGMKPDALEAAMVRFAGGDGDVLLSTNIVESGLDVPRANTMLVWRPDRFGLSQLHQLRGRVGRGRVRGVLVLLTDPASKLSVASARRLDALEANERLGAGFAISARDLDLRGAGDVLGETQAGHVKLIGVDLMQHLLQRALAAARGEPAEEEWTPEVKLDLPAFLPDGYVADADLRVELHGRLWRAPDADAVHALEDELEDRFGPLPGPVANLMELARLRVRCRQAGVAALDAGPVGAAVRLRAGVAGDVEAPLVLNGRRVTLARPSGDGVGRLGVARAMLDLLEK